MTDPLEIAATALTLVCVILAVKRSLWQFPTGIAGHGLGFFVFWNAHFYSSAVLQPIFIASRSMAGGIWLRGEQFRRPRSRPHPSRIPASWAAHLPLRLAFLGAFALEAYTDAAMAYADAAILALSVVAQALLSLKRIENWPVWVADQRHLGRRLCLNAAFGSTPPSTPFFFFNAFWGWWEWRKELRSYAAAQTGSARGCPGRTMSFL
jgi:nicotinamide mononucleotide transporter